MRAFLITAVLSIFGAGTLAASDSPTFYRDVLPILQANCQSCHRPGEVAPMSLVTYESSRPWAKAVSAYRRTYRSWALTGWLWGPGSTRP